MSMKSIWWMIVMYIEKFDRKKFAFQFYSDKYPLALLGTKLIPSLCSGPQLVAKKGNKDKSRSTWFQGNWYLLGNPHREKRKLFTWTYTSGAPSMTVLDSAEYWLYIAKAFSVINKRTFNICLEHTRRGKFFFQLEILK